MNILKNNANLKTKTTKLLIGLHIGFLLICAIFLSLSLSMLSDSKTATGVISIEMPPTLSVTSGNLYYDMSNSTMYLDESLTDAISVSTNKFAKIVLTDTASLNSAYVKIELSLLGQSNVLTIDSASSVVFSDNTTMTSKDENGIITLTSNRAVEKYSYLFLDAVFSKLKIKDTVTDIIDNATMQVLVTVSLNSNFSNNKTISLYYNFCTIESIKAPIFIANNNEVYNRDLNFITENCSASVTDSTEYLKLNVMSRSKIMITFDFGSEFSWDSTFNTENGIGFTMKSNSSGVAVFESNDYVDKNDYIILDKLLYPLKFSYANSSYIPYQIEIKAYNDYMEANAVLSGNYTVTNHSGGSSETN